MSSCPWSISRCNTYLLALHDTSWNNRHAEILAQILPIRQLTSPHIGSEINDGSVDHLVPFLFARPSLSFLVPLLRYPWNILEDVRPLREVKLVLLSAALVDEHRKLLDETSDIFPVVDGVQDVLDFVEEEVAATASPCLALDPHARNIHEGVELLDERVLADLMDAHFLSNVSTT